MYHRSPPQPQATLLATTHRRSILIHSSSPTTTCRTTQTNHPSTSQGSWLLPIPAAVAVAAAVGGACRRTTDEEAYFFSREPFVLPPHQEPWILVRDFTKEEREIYDKMVVGSNGFDCLYVPLEIAVPGLLTPVPVEGLKGLDSLEDMADIALKPYNDQNGTSYQLVKVIKATARSDGGSTYNITLQAKEDVTGSSPWNFQARKFRFMNNIKVLFCRVEQVSKPPGGSQERHRSSL